MKNIISKISEDIIRVNDEEAKKLVQSDTCYEYVCKKNKETGKPQIITRRGAAAPSMVHSKNKGRNKNSKGGRS